MARANVSEWDGHGRSSEVGPRDTDDGPRPSCAARLSGILLLAVLAYFFSYPALWAQTSVSQTGDADKSWTATTESQSDNVIWPGGGPMGRERKAPDAIAWH